MKYLSCIIKIWVGWFGGPSIVKGWPTTSYVRMGMGGWLGTGILMGVVCERGWVGCSVGS